MADFDSIPTIDLALAASPDMRAQLLANLRHAITSVGFLYVKNHGISPHVIQDMKELLPRLFSISLHDKQQVALERSPQFLGYSSVGSETTAGQADRREQFDFATELDETWTPKRPAWDRLRGPNQWPTCIPDTRTTVQTYMHELTALSNRFLVLVAESLSLPPQTFHPFLSDQHRLKLVHYPAVDAAAPSGQGVGPHKDSSGWWTFLLQASPPEVPGLQVLNKAGEWVDVPNVPNTFVVNIGQAFEVVTRGYCKATTHRVLSTAAERFSVPFFQGVRRDLTKGEATGSLADYFPAASIESQEGANIDSAFLRGKYDTWGESLLRTKIRSHKEVGRKFYAEVCDKYIND